MSERPIERWIRLRSTGKGDGAIEVPSLTSDVDSGFGPVRFAIGPEGQPRLMVPCGTGASLRGSASSGKLAVTISRYEVGGRTTRFIDVMCVDRLLDTVFAELADEIVHRVAGGNSAAEAVEGTIADFRNLLSDSPEREVPDHEIAGLIGELVVLRSLASISPKAIEAWTGPFDQRHDFRRDTQSIEVKCSTRSDSTKIMISSIDQLAEPVGGSLLLVHLNMERAASGGLTVSELATDITRKGVPMEDLAHALSAMGCANPYADTWNRVRYSLERISGYEVREGFPRITSAHFTGHTLPAGIASVTYDVDLRAAKAFQLSDGELMAQYARIAS